MSKPLFLFVGRSASGKTTVANILTDKHEYKQVESYTTRPPRFDGEPGHIFVNEEEFKNLGELAAYTFYNNHHYGTTCDQLDQCSIYVIDVPGVETLLEKYRTDRPIVIIYFDTTVYTRVHRMLDRGDSDMMIISRLLQDEKDDWYKKLDSLTWKHANIIGKNVALHSINANNNLEQVLELVLYYMKLHTED